MHEPHSSGFAEFHTYVRVEVVMDRPVENPRKRSENFKMAPNMPNTFYCR